MTGNETDIPQPYRGRFAPSPTGALHMGSLMAAVASFLEAKSRQGQWLLRMEDLDPPREVPGSAAGILQCLERFGFAWDGPVLYQSTRNEAYEAALQYLANKGLAYPCACSRKEIASTAKHFGPEGPVYPGSCRTGLPPERSGRAMRIRIEDDSRICFTDRLQGETCQDVARDIGDFVIRRADKFFAYQLAVVVDDAWQGVTDVVRGADLLLSTPRQILLQQYLDLAIPGYLHIPLLLDRDGRKLSKQARSLPVDETQPAAGLLAALTLLQQSPPAELAGANVDEIWDWAAANWQPGAMRGIRDLTGITD